MHAEGLARNVWQFALSYARYLSPPFHLWCNTVVRTAIEQSANLPTADYDPLVWQFARQFCDLHRRLDTLDRHAADLMLLALSGQDVLPKERRKFSIMNRILMIRVVAAEPYGGQCPCCDQVRILSEDGQPVPGAQIDHFFHRGLNRPEHGWLICAVCHGELTHGGYLVRFARMPQFRAFQARALEQRRRARHHRAGLAT